MVARGLPKRRRSSIVPEIVHGEPGGEGPLRIGAHFVPRGPEHQMMTWDELQEIVTSGDLDNLLRHPDCESEYIDWAKGIRAHYGGLEKYLVKERLGWDPDRLPHVDESDTSAALFFNDEAMQDIKANIKVVFNDWPYGIPSECKHYVVWCLYPIIAPALFSSSDAPFESNELRTILFKAITADGIRGATGTGDKRVPIIGDKSTEVVRQAFDAGLVSAEKPIQSHFGPTGLGPEADLAEAAHLWGNRFAERFVSTFWDPSTYETAFFCNPLHLRTVPGISHFHVIVRPKSSFIPHHMFDEKTR